MSFIRELAKSRILARQADQVGDAQVGGDGKVLEPGVLPALQPGGKPAPKKKAQGLTGAMMRQSVTDLYASGERLGLSLPMLSRHHGSFVALKANLDAFTAELNRPAQLRRNVDRTILEQLPARLLGALGPGLATLDPNGAAGAINDVMIALLKLVQGLDPVGRDQTRALERFARAAGDLKSVEMGSDLAYAIGLLGRIADPATLAAATIATLNAVPQISQAGATRSTLLRATLEASLAACDGKDAMRAIHGYVPSLTAGQVKIATGTAELAKAEHAAQKQAAAEIAGALPGKKQEFNALIDAKKGEGAYTPEQERHLRGLADRAMSELPASSQLAWFQIVNASAPRGPAVFRAIAAGLLETYASAEQTVPEVAQQTADQLTHLAQWGLDQDKLTALATEHLGWVTPTEGPATLGLVNNVLAALSEGGRKRLLGMEGVELDGSDGLTTLANSFAGQSARYARQEGPLVPLQASIEAAQNEAALKQVLKNGVRFGAAIPDFESGKIVEVLRTNLPNDLLAASGRGFDLAVVAAAHPTLPADSLPRFIGVAVKHGKDVDQWLSTLEVFFKECGGKRNHVRNFRTLIAVVDQGGSSPVELVDAMLKAKMPSAMLAKTIESILAETAQAPTPAYVAEVIAALAEGRNVRAEIDQRQTAVMVKELNLEGILGKEAGVANPRGLEELKALISRDVQSGVGNAEKTVFKQFLKGVLENRLPAAKMETKRVDHQLQSLSPRQKAAWALPLRMVHIRFDGEGLETFHDRIAKGAEVGKVLLGRMEEAWGKLGELEAKHEALLTQLRATKKDDIDARQPLILQNQNLPSQIETLRWAKAIADLTPETITPERFEKLGLRITEMEPKLGPGMEKLIPLLRAFLRVNDLSYSEVVSNDNAPASQVFEMSTTNCLHWPSRANSVLCYLMDPNKKFILTESAKGEKRRAVVRLVERQDEGHKGEPMLLLERTYPDASNIDERQRLIEHTIRRGAMMGIAVSFATEYYWDATKTGRAGAMKDMNKVLEDLCKRYGTTVEKKVISVLNRGSNLPEEYLDSDSPKNIRGTASDRTYRGVEDKVFENEFVILTPQQ